MRDQIIILTAVLLFLLTGLMTRGHNKTLEGFSAIRNRLSWFVTMAGVSMTFIGGAALLNMASLGYSYGWYTLVDPVAFMIGIFIAIGFVTNYRNDSGITISQLMTGSNNKLSLYIGIVTSVVFLLIIAAQFVAFSKLLGPYFPGAGRMILMIVPSALVLVYVFLGGFAAVTRTDVLQVFFLLVFLLLPVGYYLLSGTGRVAPKMGDDLPVKVMPKELIIYFCIFIIFIPISQDINIRVKSARTENHARAGLLFGGLFYSIVVIAAAFIGITMAKSGIPLSDPEQAFPTFFRELLPGVGIFAILAALAAVWSTLDTYLVNCITSVSEDILKRISLFKDLPERKLILAAGFSIYFLAILISIFYNQVLSLVLTALLIYVSVLIPVAVGKKLKINDNSILFLSLLTIAGISVYECGGFNAGPKPAIYLAAALVVMAGGWLYQKARPTRVR